MNKYRNAIVGLGLLALAGLWLAFRASAQTKPEQASPATPADQQYQRLLEEQADRAKRAEVTPNPNEQRVRDYVSAFNKREIDTMLSMVSDDIQWLIVAADKITVETQGKAKLRESLTGYFKSTPTAKSELEWVRATASRVAGLERASWQSRSGPKSQASLSVYEFRDGLITRVYYFPVEK